MSSLVEKVASEFFRVKAYRAHGERFDDRDLADARGAIAVVLREFGYYTKGDVGEVTSFARENGIET